MKNFLFSLIILIAIQVNAQNRTQVEIIQEYSNVKLTVIDLKEAQRGFLKIPIWSIRYKIESRELEKVDTKLGIMSTQKCNTVPKVIKNGHIFNVTVKKIKVIEKGIVNYSYNINPRQLGIDCPYSWNDI